MTPSSGASSTGGYKLDKEQPEQSVLNAPVPSVPPVLNINDLFQKLVASGFVTTMNQPVPINQSPPKITEVAKKGSEPMQTGQQEQTATIKTRRSICDLLKPISFDKMETLKARQQALYGGLYSGMQCSSCGMRFSPEASMLYSQHLDWHFRQNRKGKRNIRVAASRKWYYSLADWKNYEELEDLEERGNINNDIMLLIVYDLGFYLQKRIILTNNSNQKELEMKGKKKLKFLVCLQTPNLQMNAVRFVEINLISSLMKKKRNGIFGTLLG